MPHGTARPTAATCRRQFTTNRAIMKIKLLIISLICTAIPSMAVTKEEMEQARVIAAQAYLRYANNGSGYLDDLHPKSMAELESKLKAKEKENIKAFKAVGTPSDYGSWDKEKLVEYWGTTFFKAKGLDQAGLGARTRVRTRVGALKVSAPAPDKVKPAPAEPAPAEPAADAPQGSPATAQAGNDSPAPAEAAMQQLSAIEDSAAASLADAEEQAPVERESSSTWIYVLVLVILVGVVIALVAYASSIMKRQSRDNAGGRTSSGSDDDGENERLRSRLAETVAAKNNEIAALQEQLRSAEARSRRSDGEAASLRGELESLRSEITALRGRLAAAEAVRNTDTAVSAAARTTASRPDGGNTHAAETPRRRPSRTIYLGRVNSRGIFVRADRDLNPGQTVYVLHTTDGMSGTFEVADDPTICEVALMTPVETLGGGCTATHLDNPGLATAIETDTPGMAVFEGGCWRVARKARISYR